MTVPGFTIRDRDAPLWAGVASALALLTALGSQHLGGLPPCELCLWQRAPHGAVVVIGVGALLWFGGGRERQILTWLATLALLAGAGIALYHVGVEQKWIAGPAACSGAASLNDAKTVEELRDALLAAPVVRCDEVAWSLWGVSMAGWNALFSVLIAAYCGVAGVRQLRDKTA